MKSTKQIHNNGNIECTKLLGNKGEEIPDTSSAIYSNSFKEGGIFLVLIDIKYTDFTTG